MSRRLPPLNPLHAFEVVARHGSFTKAAGELGVTQSAVSRQVAVLEGFLKCSLLHRERGGASLTAEGRRYWQDIAKVFDVIAKATEAAMSPKPGTIVRVRTYNTFASRWLLPRLPRFREEHPAIEVRLSTGIADVDFRRDQVDVAIQFGAGNWPGLSRKLLLPDVIQPVCSPKLLRRRNAPRRIEDLARCTLLHTKYRRDDWATWLKAVGGPEVGGTGMVLPGSVLAYQAALEGLGIAMGQIPLLGPELTSGVLVPLFDRPLRRPLAHYAVWPSLQKPGFGLRLFLGWLEREAGVEGAEAPDAIARASRPARAAPRAGAGPAPS